MGQSVDEFRAKTLNYHLNCEMLMNYLIANYFFPKTRPSSFDTLILEKMSFSRKINIMRELTAEPFCHSLGKLYENIVWNKVIYQKKGKKTKKEISLKYIEGIKINKELFTFKDLMTHLNRINDIRNHLSHNLVLSPVQLKEAFPGKSKYVFISKSKINMECKGSMEELEESYNFVFYFIKGLKKKADKKVNKKKI